MILRAAVVGVGHLGRWHAQKLKQIEGVDLVALVEPDAARAEEMGKEFGLAPLDSIEALPAIDLAIVATPTLLHLTVAEALLARGVHLLIEKPVVPTPADGARLLAAARRAGKIVQVGHIERFNPAVVAAEAVFDQPWYMVSERLGPFKTRSLDVDVIDDLMIHDIDLCLAWMGGGEVADVRAVGVSIMTNLVDMANARIEFASGAVASLTASRSSLESSRKVRLFTEQRYLSLDLEKKEAKSVRRLRAAEPGGWPEIEGEPMQVVTSDALLEQDRAFVRACIEGSKPKVTLEAGLAAVELAARVKQALRTPGIDSLKRAGLR